jgi:cation:H+ antiporter
MLLPGLLFILGVIILLICANEFVKQATLLSARFRLSPLIIGTTVVAVGTSLPELTVSLISVFEGDPGLAWGNIVGSNIMNILLVLGLAVTLGRIRVGTTKTPRNALTMILVTWLFIFFYHNNQPLLAGFTLIGAFVLFMIMEWSWGIEGRLHEDLLRIKQLFKKPEKSSWSLFWLSLLGVAGGGLLTVTNAETISGILKLSTTVFGLSATAIATSLPELLVTIISEEKGQEKLALGNVIGSNICNLGFIGGLLFLFPGKTILPYAIWIFLFGSALINLAVVWFYRGRVIPHKIGLVLLLLLLGYFGLMAG